MIPKFIQFCCWCLIFANQKNTIIWFSILMRVTIIYPDAQAKGSVACAVTVLIFSSYSFLLSHLTAECIWSGMHALNLALHGWWIQLQRDLLCTVNHKYFVKEEKCANFGTDLSYGTIVKSCQWQKVHIYFFFVKFYHVI